MKKKSSKEVDEKFATAIQVLSWYENHHYPGHVVSNGTHVTFCERMEAAKAEDKSASKLLNGLKEMLCLKVRLIKHITPSHINTAPQATDDKKPETMTVEFHLLKSLPDERPTIVRRER